MTMEPQERRLAAILAADMVGYSRLMECDETGTLARLKTHRLELIDPTIAKNKGRIIKTTGDGMLVEFQSVADAVECAAEIQERLESLQAEGLHVRIGISAGEPVTEEGDLFGAAVSLASRVCAHCDPGGILVSTAVRELAVGKGFKFIDRGVAELKGFDEPVRLWSVEQPPA